MFFRKKKKDTDISEAELKVDLGSGKKSKAVEGTSPMVEESTIKALAEETVGASIVAPLGGATSMTATGDMIRLFPGFERDDFEMGFRSDLSAPALVMRWKDGGEWFTVPGLFNRAVLASMDERDSASDLNRLLRNYGYDVETAAE